MKHIKALGVGGVVGLILILGGVHGVSGNARRQANPGNVPQFEYDATWPKPLPNNWRLGTVVGVRVDSNDHIWIVQRPNSLRPDERYAAGPSRRPSAVSRPRRSSSSIKRAMCCRLGEGPVKDTNGPPMGLPDRTLPSMAFPSTTRGTCGSAATT